MKKYWLAGLVSLLMTGAAVAQGSNTTQSTTTNTTSTSGDTAKVERVHGKESESQVQERMAKSQQILSQLTDANDSAIPDKILKDARCVAIIPSMVKGGFVFGAEHGRGVATCRVDGRWSAPAFLTATGGNWGAQIGLEGIDLVMVFRNQEGADKLLDANFKIGADVSAAVGPIGRDASASTDIKANTAILTYSRAKGAFAGVTLDGVSVRPDKDSTIALYGHDVDFRAALTGKVQPPPEAQAFLAAVHHDMRDVRENEAKADAH